MEKEEFEELVVEALEGLPEVFRQKMENVAIVIEDEPTPEEVRAGKVKRDDLLMGLYQGVPLSKRTHYYGEVLPDKITIFQKNIERACRTEDDMKRIVVHTVRHELAHHFGISDERLRESGIY